jgi:hypothetical protein
VLKAIVATEIHPAHGFALSSARLALCRKGRKVTNAEMKELLIKRDAFRGEWNYEIHPRDER